MARHLHMSNTEYIDHNRTYHAFTHLLLWFAIHVALILLGLFALGMTDAPSGGVVLILIGIAALGYGVMSAPRAARKEAGYDRETAESPVVAEDPREDR